MITAQEVRSVIRQFYHRTDPNPIAAQFYAKLAIRTYYEAIVNAPFRDREKNERAFEVALEFYAKAVSLGLPEECVDVPFYNLR